VGIELVRLVDMQVDRRVGNCVAQPCTLWTGGWLDASKRIEDHCSLGV
jgi:hypothetical protein